MGTRAVSLFSPEGPTWAPRSAVSCELEPLAAAPLPAESSFYSRYAWCLDVFPTVRDVSHDLRGEVARFQEELDDWQRQEVAVNIFLLSCAVADALDDFMAGESYDFSTAAVLPGMRALTGALERVLDVRHRVRALRQGGLRRWRAAWGAAQDEFLQAWLADGPSGRAELASKGALALAGLLNYRLPRALACRRINVPAAFRTQDLTHHDVVALAEGFAAAFPDRERPLLVLGPRTAGSYFVPLVHASLKLRGYRDVETATLRPKKRVAPWEVAALERCARRQGLALVVDEPASTGATLARTSELLGRAGVPAQDTVLLFPVHPTRRDWSEAPECLPLRRSNLITLEPEGWHKQEWLQPEPVARRLQQYFEARGYAQVELSPSRQAEGFNERLRDLSEEKFHSRLKCVYEVRLRDTAGRSETRFVLAKSVGWGWLGYHAFLAAQRLAEFVPPLLGLRDGILYLEWLPQGGPEARPSDRETLVLRAASYVAARAQRLGLPKDPEPELLPHQLKGVVLLSGELCRAFTSKRAASLQRPRLRRELTRACPLPTLVDGKMRRLEWVKGPRSWLKTDFEHHGMGRTALNVTDPAYDLAEASLGLGLSAAEEQILIQRYRQASGDQDIDERLFPYQLLAGIYALKSAMSNLRDPRLRHRHQEFNRSYVEAADFLAVRSARFCGRRCRRPDALAWGSPLLALDVDGVLDTPTFGFPSTTAAGIEALRVLHAHGVCLVLNSERTLDELREYSRTYGCAGAVAEYGSVVWDALADRTQVLLTEESADQLQRLEQALRRMPGVFFDERHRHSLRTYRYEGGRTLPLPKAILDGTIADLGLDRLRVHQTEGDSGVRAREVDKGKGLLALLALAGVEHADTIAIGDSEADLAMFEVASRAFAPGHIAEACSARRLGCRITRRARQPGLLSAVRSIVHPGKDRCTTCEEGGRPAAGGLFGQLLKEADRPPLASLARALMDPLSFQAFRR